MDTPYPMCQSCSMLMESIEDFGIEKDNEKNSEYCKYCYNNGTFTDQGITLREKIEKTTKIATQMGMDEKKAKAIAENIIPKLKRWNSPEMLKKKMELNN